MPRKKGAKVAQKIAPKEENQLKNEVQIFTPYKATLKSVGREYKSEGATIEEALRKIKISGGAKAVSVLSVEHDNKRIDKILSGITTHHLFGQGSPTIREIHLSKVKQLFDL